jgi:hypothetical protein
MPNWNNANLVLKGTKENIDLIVETGFDFQKIIPMPQEILEDSEGKNLGGRNWNIGDEAGTLEEWQTHCKTDKERAEMKLRYEEHLEDFKLVVSWIDKYGVNGWYDWSIKNWGTKWNPYPDSVQLDRISDTELNVDLKTAWDLPTEILKELIRKYDVIISGSQINEYDNKQRAFAL